MSPAFMSDEETDDEGGFTIRKPKWRSDLLNRLLSHLDKRYDDSRKNSTIRTKPRERRQPGDSSERHKPFGAPAWAVQEESAPSSRPGEAPSSEPLTPSRSHSDSEPNQGSSSVVTPTGIPNHFGRPSRSRSHSGLEPNQESSSVVTPTGIPNNFGRPTHLFNRSSDSSDDLSDPESDGELSTMIRAATMQLY